LPWQPFFGFLWGAHWRHLVNTTDLSIYSGDAALCQITLTTCLVTYHFIVCVNRKIKTREQNLKCCPICKEINI